MRFWANGIDLLNLPHRCRFAPANGYHWRLRPDSCSDYYGNDADDNEPDHYPHHHNNPDHYPDYHNNSDHHTDHHEYCNNCDFHSRTVSRMLRRFLLI